MWLIIGYFIGMGIIPMGIIHGLIAFCIMPSPVQVASQNPWALPVFLLMQAFSLAVGLQWSKFLLTVSDRYIGDDGSLRGAFIYTFILTGSFILVAYLMKFFPSIQAILD